MNNIVSALVIVVAFLLIFNIYVLYKFYMIENELERLDILGYEVLNLKSVAISHTRQIGELRISIGKLQGNYSDSAEKSQS